MIFSSTAITPITSDINIIHQDFTCGLSQNTLAGNERQHERCHHDDDEDNDDNNHESEGGHHDDNKDEQP